MKFIFKKTKINKIADRRKFKRKYIGCPAQIYSKDIKQNLGDGFVTDLSEDGIKILSSQIFDPGEEFSIHFSIPNGWRFDFFGRIIYKEKAIFSTAYGIQFSPGQSNFILSLL